MTRDITGIITFPKGNKTFKNYCDTRSGAGKLQVIKYLECHELCDECIQNTSLLESNETYNKIRIEIRNLSPTGVRLPRKIESIGHLINIFEETKESCKASIERDDVYDDFLKLMHKKLKSVV